jgi:glutamate---cysteine ligase / carboxylate-amine ligase
MANAATIGVEEEFFLVDKNGLLVQRAPEALHDAGADDLDLKPELLRCEVESATGVCANGSEVYEQLTGLRERLARGAARNGARLAATGTVVHQQPGDPPIGPGTRYHLIAEHFGRLVAGSPVCGCHVHVGIEDRELALRVSNHLRPWLPVLLALSANSPFLDGRDTGYASSRHVIYSRWPSAGPPPYLESLDHYEAILAGLLETGAALDRKMIYWDLRPSEHQPTIEVRVPDAMITVREAVFAAVVVRTLVRTALDLLADGVAAPRVPTEVIRAGLWRAAKDGVSGRCPDPETGRARPVLAILGDLVRANSKRLSQDGELEPALSTLDYLERHGGGADRQRRAYATGQLDGVLEEVTFGTASGVSERVGG